MNLLEKLEITEAQGRWFWEVWAGDWHHADHFFDMVWLGYDTLADQTAIPVKSLKKLIQAFRAKGLAQHTTTIDSDGRPHGSGTFLILGSEHKTWDEIKEIMGWIQ